MINEIGGRVKQCPYSLLVSAGDSQRELVESSNIISFLRWECTKLGEGDT